MKTFTRLAAAAALLIAATGAGATILNVNVSGNGDYYTVSEALNYAMPGDVVMVHSGTYSTAGGEKFPISVPTDVSVVGDEAAKPVFTPGSRTTAFEVRDESRVVLRSLIIREAGTGIAITGNADHVTIDKCEVYDCRSTGITAHNSKDPSITATIISGTPVAVELNNCGTATLAQNTLAGLTGHDNSTAVAVRKTGLKLSRTIIDGFAEGIMIRKTDLARISMKRNNISGCAVPFRHDKTGIRTFSTRDKEGNGAFDPRFVNRENGDFHLQLESPLSGLGAFPVNTLPVNFAGLEGTVQYETVQLSWTTHAEKNNKGWNVYRGFSPEGPFEKISSDMVMGAGTSSSARNYTYFDENVPPMCDDLYYYIEQISTDGESNFSKTVNVSTRMPVTSVTEDIFTD